MELTFLGTAAEGYPDPFCACGNCERARELGGRSLRKRSAALIDDQLLIDFSPDLVTAAQQHGRSLAGLCYALQTHQHPDHLDASLLYLYARSSGCATVTGRPEYYASATALALAARQLGELLGELPVAGLLNPAISDRFNLHSIAITPFQTFTVGAYRVGSVAATHAPGSEAMLFAIGRDDRALFYGTDTGPLPEATWDYLKQGSWRFSVVILDHTLGLGRLGEGHLNAAQMVAAMARFRAEGLVADDVRFYAHHIAHHSNPPHPELAAFAAGHGYNVAYDGLTVVV